MSSLVCYRLGHALQQWDRYPRSTERISCLPVIKKLTNSPFSLIHVPNKKDNGKTKTIHGKCTNVAKRMSVGKQLDYD